MKQVLRLLALPFLLLAVAFSAPVVLAAAPLNDEPGTRIPVPANGGSVDWFTASATMEAGYFEYGTPGATWAWSLWFDWTAPLAGAARMDLCNTPTSDTTWYLSAWNATEFMSPIARDVGASGGCTNAAMPQGDFTAVAGRNYMIAVGAKDAKNVQMVLRVTYVPQVDQLPTVAGSAALGQTLRATAPTFTTDPAMHQLGVRWARCAAVGAPCTPVLAGSDTYVVQQADVGSRLRVEYTATSPAGSIDAVSALTSTIAASPVDLDDDGIPDELVAALGIAPGAAGIEMLCTRFTLCKDDKRQSAIFNSWNTMNVIDGKLLDLLLGSIQPDILVADQSRTGGAKSKPLTCNGAGGDDVCIGSKGADRCIAYIGDDFCLGGAGKDTCVSKAGNDVCYGGAGADTCTVQPVQIAKAKLPPVPKASCLGGPGADRCVVNLPRVPLVNAPVAPHVSCDGAIGNDTCKAAAAMLVKGLNLTKPAVLRMNCSGGAGRDTCGAAKTASSALAARTKATCSGGTGNDLCVAKGASSWAAGAFGAHNAAMVCNGGPGNDTLWTLNGKGGDRINGGGQAGDICFADANDTATGCGQVVRWSVDLADLKLINGTRAQQEQFARESNATINGKQLSVEDTTRLAGDINDQAAKLNQLLQSQTDAMRKLLDGAAMTG